LLGVLHNLLLWEMVLCKELENVHRVDFFH
jgi:hypothetical protein